MAFDCGPSAIARKNGCLAFQTTPGLCSIAYRQTISDPPSLASRLWGECTEVAGNLIGRFLTLQSRPYRRRGVGPLKIDGYATILAALCGAFPSLRCPPNEERGLKLRGLR